MWLLKYNKFIAIAALWIPLVLLGLSPQKERQAQERFEKVFRELLTRYVAEINPEKLSNHAISSLLADLDPYSEYILKENEYRLDVLTKGQYGGIGLKLGRQNDTLVVITPMAGSPAEQRGIRPGDRIIKIDSVWTRDLSTHQAAQMVRGPAGEPVALLIKRYGVNEPLVFHLIREIIRVEDITYSGLVSGRVGYVKLASFSRYTAIHLEQEIHRLQQSGMTAFILDLRGNPGGLLHAALETADLFLPQNEMILETRGRLPSANKVYHTKRRPVLPETPMVVLMDGGSASASEIVGGILQDLDRAVVLGSRTFGKGLVQTVYPVDEKAILKLTTAKYYLPSGRLIQKAVYGEGLIREDDDLVDSLDYLTRQGRHVKGGGGIRPDVEVAPLLVDRYERQLWQQGLFFQFAVQYVNSHDDLILPFHATDSEVEAFRDWLGDQGYEYATDFTNWLDKSLSLVDTTVSVSASIVDLLERARDLASVMEQEAFDANYDRIRLGIEREVAAVIGGTSARFAAGMREDLVLEEALSLLRQPGAVTAILHGETVARSVRAD
ncbi:MAG: S41 family peptidase [Lentisphaeria bacterium]|nr:S41 family peptidase [Candidatus Neomarinimicrobiota bacterium]MCF7842674.1 S41 family peptidase [Lentisphaeria bacterium]